MRTWLSLWLCACLLIASPVRGACCFGAGADAAPAVTTDADAELPPCHRMAAAEDHGSDRQPSPSPGGDAGCDHCQCPCRAVAVALTPAPDGLLPAPTFPPVAALAGFAERSLIPPLPPPIV